MTRVIGYCRVSTEEQGAGDSLAAQEAAIRAHCTARGLELVRVETDAGFSASTLDREGLYRARDAIMAGEASGLVVVKLDRLTRSVADLCDLRRDGGLGHTWELISIAEQIDTESPMGNAFLQILTVFAELERKNTGRRTKDLLAYAKSQGQPLGGVPYGWRRVKVERDANGRRVGERGRLERDEGQQRTLGLIRALRERDGYSLEQVAASLNANGVTGGRGGRWTKAQVRRVLKASAPQAA